MSPNSDPQNPTRSDPQPWNTPSLTHSVHKNIITPSLLTDSVPPLPNWFKTGQIAKMAQPQQALLATRTPAALEYERQAEERSKEQDRMQRERESMNADIARTLVEADDFAQKGMVCYFWSLFDVLRLCREGWGLGWEKGGNREEGYGGWRRGREMADLNRAWDEAVLWVGGAEA